MCQFRQTLCKQYLGGNTFMVMRVTEDLTKNMKKCSINYETQHSIFVAVIVVNITEIPVYPNT